MQSSGMWQLRKLNVLYGNACCVHKKGVDDVDVSADWAATMMPLGWCVTAERKDRRKAEEKTRKEGEHLD